MANNYKKFTLADFKEKLKDGGYAAPVGARRAIGKFADWSDEDKDKARRAVDAHFGEEGGSAQKKTAKKAPAKRAKKAARKAAAAPAKKAAKKAPAAAPAKRGRKPRAAAAPQASAPAGRRANAVGFGGDADTVDRMTRIIGTMSDAVNSIRLAREMTVSDPKELDEALLTATRAMARALGVLDDQVSDHLQLTGKKEPSKKEPVAEAKPRTLKDEVGDRPPTEEEQKEADALSHAANSSSAVEEPERQAPRAEA